jgi:putative SOS response-associated peptidase YedK
MTLMVKILDWSNGEAHTIYARSIKLLQKRNLVSAAYSQSLWYFIHAIIPHRTFADSNGMCNLYNLKATRWELDAAFSAASPNADELEKEYVAPGRQGYVVRETAGSRVLDRMRWGFPPPVAASKPVVNVRNYTSPFWRTALKTPERRCLVPVTEFQEWAVEPAPATGQKRPHWFSLPSRPIFAFAFAGVWRPTETGGAYAFLTCGYDGDPAGHIVGAVHPKACPVVLHEEDYDRWLTAPVEDALGLACTFPSQLMAIA